MKKKRDLGLLWFYIILMLSVLMVNPPILPFVNTYCVEHPMTFGWPTLFLWLEFWYAVMILDFLWGALRLKSWDWTRYPKDIQLGKRAEQGR
mgnify:FL=1